VASWRIASILPKSPGRGARNTTSGGAGGNGGAGAVSAPADTADGKVANPSAWWQGGVKLKKVPAPSRSPSPPSPLHDPSPPSPVRSIRASPAASPARPLVAESKGDGGVDSGGGAGDQHGHGPGPAEYIRLVVVAWEAVHTVLTAAERTVHKQNCRRIRRDLKLRKKVTQAEKVGAAGALASQPAASTADAGYNRPARGGTGHGTLGSQNQRSVDNALRFVDACVDEARSRITHGSAYEPHTSAILETIRACGTCMGDLWA